MLTDRERQIAGFAFRSGQIGESLDVMAQNLQSAEADGVFDIPAEGITTQ